MINNLLNLTHLEIRENAEGKEEKILVIECNKCSNFKKHLYYSKECILCLLTNIFHNRIVI